MHGQNMKRMPQNSKSKDSLLILFLLMQEKSKYISMENSPASTQKFKIPKSQFEANDTELNKLKKKMLANYYDQQIQHKEQNIRKETTASSNTMGSSQNPQSSSYNPTYMDINTMIIKRQRDNKQKLAKDYQEQMKNKLALQKRSQERKLYEEKKMLHNLEQIKIKQQEHYRREQERYRAQMLEQLQKQKQNKRYQQELRQKQKQQYSKKYTDMPSQALSKNIDSSSITILNNPYKNNKVSKFKQHYDNVNQVQFQIFKNFVDNWGPDLRQRQLQKQRMIEAGIYKVHKIEKQTYQQRQKKQTKFKTELKQALQKQIKQKQQEKYSARLRNKSQNYTPSIYKNIHHPIYNPVDFKMAHDNKHILRELKQQKESERQRSEEREGSRMSGLAKKGSMVILPSYKAQF